MKAKNLCTNSFAVGVAIAIVWLILTLMTSTGVVVLGSLFWITALIFVLFIGVSVEPKWLIVSLLGLGFAWFVLYALGAVVGLDFMVSAGLAADLPSHPYAWLLFPINGCLLINLVAAVCGAYFYVESKVTVKTRLEASGRICLSIGFVSVGFVCVALLSSFF